MTKTLKMLFLLWGGFMQAQELPHDILSCGTDDLPDNKQVYNQKFEDFYQNRLQLKAKQASTIYYIPIVFHVIHCGEPIGSGSNVSDQEVYNALELLNNNYKNAHNHSSSGDTRIQFVLATKAPDGSCSSGINRINFEAYSTYLEYGIGYTATDNGITPNAIRALYYWNKSQYYNVWIVNKITSDSNVLGFATYPTQHGAITDGTFLVSKSFKEAGNKILTHEIGHSLNLYHTFQGSQGSNCPSEINGCGNNGDCVEDTPPHQKSHPSNLQLTAFNSCTNDNNSSFKHNYMTYSQQQYINVFTPGQIVRMQSAIDFYRASYLPANNSIFTMTKLPTAEFLIDGRISSEKQFYCAGTPIKLKNTSSCFLNTFNDTKLDNYKSEWTIKKNNTIILTSTENNPAIVLDQAGTYSITLKVTNNIGSSTVVKNDIIEINAASTVGYCVPFSFNVGYFGYAVELVELNNIRNATVVRTNEKYRDFSCSNIAVLYKGTSNKLKLVMSAHSDPMKVKVFIDYNKNGIFSSDEEVVDDLIPGNTTSEEFTYEITPRATAATNEVYRMRIFTDKITLPSVLNCLAPYSYADVEDYGVYIFDTLDNETFETEALLIYPNPTSDFLTIDAPVLVNETIEIYDVQGKLHQKVGIVNEKKFTIDVRNLAAGTYLLKTKARQYKFVKN